MVASPATRARDELAEMFCKRMPSIIRLATAELAEIRERQAEMSEWLISPQHLHGISRARPGVATAAFVLQIAHDECGS
jgi:hypothetical protein